MQHSKTKITHSLKPSIAGLLFIIFTLASCGGGGNRTEQLDKLKKQQAELTAEIRKLEQELALTDTTKKEKIKTVQALSVASQLFTHYIEVQAKVEGDEDVNVTATTQGIVTEVLVHAGDKVSKGQILATLDDKMVAQSMGEMQSQVDLATTVYNRQKNLWDQKIGSEVQFLTAKTNKEALEKRLGTMREQWNMTRIKSPINGTVDNVAIKIGQAVMPGIITKRYTSPILSPRHDGAVTVQGKAVTYAGSYRRDICQNCTR